MEADTLLPHSASVMSSTWRTVPKRRPVHLNKRILYDVLTATVFLYDSRLKGDPIKFGDLDGDVARGYTEVPNVVTTSCSPGSARCTRTGLPG